MNSDTVPDEDTASESMQQPASQGTTPLLHQICQLVETVKNPIRSSELESLQAEVKTLVLKLASLDLEPYTESYITEGQGDTEMQAAATAKRDMCQSQETIKKSSPEEGKEKDSNVVIPAWEETMHEELQDIDPAYEEDRHVCYKEIHAPHPSSSGIFGDRTSEIEVAAPHKYDDARHADKTLLVLAFDQFQPLGAPTKIKYAMDTKVFSSDNISLRAAEQSDSSGLRQKLHSTKCLTCVKSEEDKLPSGHKISQYVLPISTDSTIEQNRESANNSKFVKLEQTNNININTIETHKSMDLQSSIRTIINSGFESLQSLEELTCSRSQSTQSLMEVTNQGIHEGKENYDSERNIGATTSFSEHISMKPSLRATLRKRSWTLNRKQRNASEQQSCSSEDQDHKRERITKDHNFLSQGEVGASGTHTLKRRKVTVKIKKLFLSMKKKL